MNRQIKRKKTVITGKQAASLLYPIAAFFRNGGLTRAQSLAALAHALDYVDKSKRQALEHIGASSCYLDLIAKWSRERKFLDARGYPRDLPLSGANGFTSLARSVGAGHDPKKLLSVLVRYRNVRSLSGGRVQLISPLFRASSGSRIAFEPIAHFLRDTTSTLTHILKSAGRSESPLFWRSVESRYVSKANAAKFMAFAKERSLLFLEELDDWLRAHERYKSGNRKTQLRVGLGLFSIYSHGARRP